MKLPLTIAVKLLLLMDGEKIASSRLRHPIVDELIGEGILLRPGKTKSLIQLINQNQEILIHER